MSYHLGRRVPFERKKEILLLDLAAEALRRLGNLLIRRSGAWPLISEFRRALSHSCRPRHMCREPLLVGEEIQRRRGLLLARITDDTVALRTRTPALQVHSRLAWGVNTRQEAKTEERYCALSTMALKVLGAMRSSKTTGLSGSA